VQNFQAWKLRDQKATKEIKTRHLAQKEPKEGIDKRILLERFFKIKKVYNKNDTLDG
jgi:hypothetical protein